MLAKQKDELLAKAKSELIKRINNHDLLEDSSTFLSGLNYNNEWLLNLDDSLRWNVETNIVKHPDVNVIHSLDYEMAIEIFVELCNA